MSLSRLIVFLTSFGSTMFMRVSLQNHDRLLALIGALVLVVGFFAASKLNRKPALVVKE